MKIEAMDDETVQGIIQKAVEDAVDFIEAEITEPRLKSQRYYDGEVDIGFEDGRSRVVATKCREVVKSLKPSIQRVFLSTENVVEFVPRMPEDVQVCEQMTKFANYKFMQNNGYRLLNDVFQDAMVKCDECSSLMRVVVANADFILSYRNEYTDFMRRLTGNPQYDSNNIKV